MKIVKSVLITLTLLIVLPIVVLIVYYQFDEKLDPKAAAWGEPRATTIPEAENGYYALIAMGAGDGADAPAYAREWIAEARAAAKENRPERRPKVQRAKRPDVCKPLQASCLNLVREKKVELTTALDAYTEDLARYRMLIDSKRFEEVLDYPVNIYSEIPSLRYLESARNAWLTQAALFAEAGNLEEAISAVERDVAYNRIMLVGARSWPIKNNSIAPYWTDLVFIADLLQQKATALEPFVPRLREMLKSIDPAALRRGDTLETYFGAIKPMLRNPREFRNVYMEEKDLPPAARMIAVVYRPNAAINYQYKQYSEMAAVFNQPPRDIVAARGKVEQPKNLWNDITSVWDLINYNPIDPFVGVPITVEKYNNYDVLREHDLDAFNRLLALRVEALAANVDAAQAAEFVAKSALHLYDPYTGKPMVWDAAKKRFQFKAGQVQRAKLWPGDVVFVTL